MLALTSYPALDVFIGLAFFYFLLSIVASSINEGIATVFALRATTLEAGLRNMLGDNALVDTFYEDPRVQALMRPTRRWLHPTRWFGLKQRNYSFGKLHYSTRDTQLRRKPSYIPSRAFALALLDSLDKRAMETEGAGHTGVTESEPSATEGTEPADTPAAPAANEPDAQSGLDHLIAQAHSDAATIRNDQISTMVKDAINEAGNASDAAEKFRKSLERQFDEAMERVSGWYKRRTQLFLFVIALVLAGATNADSFVVGQRLWKDDVLRSAVVAQAQNTVKNKQADCAKAPAGKPTPTDAEIAGKCLDQVKQLNIPLGWSKASSPSGFWEDLAKAGGLLLTAFALLLGAPFWFDTLSKLAQLRGTGRASADPSTPEGATTTKTDTPA